MDVIDSDQDRGARGTSDAELAQRVVRDPRVFDELYLRHVDAVFAFIAARIGRNDAEDVTSEAFTIAFRRIASFDQSATSMRPWLYGIAANRLHKHRDAEQRWLERVAASSRAIDGSGAADAIDDADARLDAERMAPRLARALSGLRPGERDVLVLHVLEGMQHTEIARVLGIRPGSAKSRLSRGRARLEQELTDLQPEQVRT